MAIDVMLPELVTILESEEDVVNVHDYKVDITDVSRFDEQCRDSQGRINYCEIESSPIPPENYACGVIEKFFEFRITFYFGLTYDDETRKIFDNLVASVVRLLTINVTLNNTSAESEVSDTDGPVEVKVGGTICHRARVTLRAAELENVTYL